MFWNIWVMLLRTIFSSILFFNLFQSPSCSFMVCALKKTKCWFLLLCLQVTKRVGSHCSIQALQQTPRVCSDETSSGVSSQTRYVSTYRCTSCEWASFRGKDHRKKTCFFVLSFSSSCLADIPVFPTITATVTFQEFRYDKFDESIFLIPAEYKEDPSRFPDLWPVNASSLGEWEQNRGRWSDSESILTIYYYY